MIFNCIPISADPKDLNKLPGLILEAVLIQDLFIMLKP